MQELPKNREIQLNQQTIRCQVLADMIKIWSCFIFIKLCALTQMQSNSKSISNFTIERILAFIVVELQRFATLFCYGIILVKGMQNQKKISTKIRSSI